MTTASCRNYGFRGRDDSVGLNTDTWTFPQDTNFSYNVDEIFRIRFGCQEVNNKSYNLAWQIEYNLNGTGWNNVTTTSNVIQAVPSAQFNDGDAITASLLTGETQAWINGAGDEDGAPPGVIQMQNIATEYEYSMQIQSADVSNNDTIEIRVYGLSAGFEGGVTVTAIKAVSYNLTVQDANQAQTSDNVDLTQAYVLTISDAQQDMTSDNVDLSQLYTLTTQDAQQDITSDNVNVTYHEPTYEAVASNTQHTQTSDNVDLTQTYVLTISDANQAQTSDNIELTHVYLLEMQDSYQGLSSDNISLAQGYALTINDSNQAQTSDNINLLQGGAIGAQNSIHELFSDSIELTQHHLLTTISTTHTQVSDNIILSQGNTLTTQDSIHQQFSDNIALIQAYVLIIAIATHTMVPENVTLGGAGIIPIMMMHYRRLRSK